jgi:transposase
MKLTEAHEIIAQKDAARILEFTTQKDAQIESLVRKLESTQRQLTTLQHQMEQLLKRLYGRTSEKITPGQLMFDDIVLQSLNQEAPVLPEAAPVTQTAKKTRRASRHHGRVPIPEHLERVEILLDVPEEKKINADTGEPLKVMSVEVSEKLKYRPGRLIVNVYTRPHYAQPEASEPPAGVIAASLPDHPIAKCKADVGLLSHLIVSKYADHLPFYRQNGTLEREGVDIPRARPPRPAVSCRPMRASVLWKRLFNGPSLNGMCFLPMTRPYPCRSRGTAR